MGKDMDCPPVASPVMADQVAPLLDAPQASFDAPQEALVLLSPAVGQDKTQLHPSHIVGIFHRATVECHATNIYTEAAHLDTTPFGC